MYTCEYMNFWDSIIDNKDILIKLLQLVFVLILVRAFLKVLNFFLSKVASKVRSQRQTDVSNEPANKETIISPAESEINNELFQELEMYLSQFSNETRPMTSNKANNTPCS